MLNYRTFVVALVSQISAEEPFIPMAPLAELQSTYALLVTDAGGELVKTPLLHPDTNKVVRLGHFVLNSDGALTGEVAEDRSGDFATEERYHLRDADQRQRISDFERWLGHSLQGFTLDGMSISDAEKRQSDLSIKYKLAVPQYGHTRGPLMLVRPRVLGNESSFIEHGTRRYPLELRRTAQEIDTYEIEIPKEYQVDDVPDPVEIDVGFASYQSKIALEGSKLRYWREYVVREVSVPPQKFKDWAKLQGSIGADESAVVVLKRVQ